MSKRKRETDAHKGARQTENQAPSIHGIRLRATIKQGCTALTSALKLARGFERQKLSRRQKAASISNDGHTLLRIKEEIYVLKQLDMINTAQNYLLKQLVKTRRIAESPTFVETYGGLPKLEPVKAGAETNVLARLFKSMPVTKIMPDIRDGILRVLGLSQTGHDSHEQGKGLITSTESMQ